MYEKQIEQIYGKKSNIEMQIMALESAASNKEVLDVMRLGKDALKQAIQATSVTFERLSNVCLLCCKEMLRKLKRQWKTSMNRLLWVMKLVKLWQIRLDL